MCTERPGAVRPVLYRAPMVVLGAPRGVEVYRNQLQGGNQGYYFLRQVTVSRSPATTKMNPSRCQRVSTSPHPDAALCHLRRSYSVVKGTSKPSARTLGVGWRHHSSLGQYLITLILFRRPHPSLFLCSLLLFILFHGSSCHHTMVQL